MNLLIANDIHVCGASQFSSHNCVCKDTQCAFWGKGNVISGGEPSALLHKEASSFLSREEKMALIKEVGIVDIGPGEVCSLRLLFL